MEERRCNGKEMEDMEKAEAEAKTRPGNREELKQDTSKTEKHKHQNF